MSALTGTLLMDGNNTFTMNGAEQKVASLPFTGNIVRAYLFAMSTIPVIDLSVVQPSGNDCEVVGIHRMALHGFSPGAYALPAWVAGYADMWSGEQVFNFQPDSVPVTGLDVYLYGASGTASVFLEVWSRDTP